MLFAIITGAHLFPFGWLYNSKPYYIMAPVISVAVMLLGLYLNGKNLWLIPFSVAILLVILIFLLYIEYKRKIEVNP